MSSEKNSEIKSKYGDYKGRDYYYEPFAYDELGCQNRFPYSTLKSYGNNVRSQRDRYWKGRNCAVAKNPSAFQGVA